MLCNSNDDSDKVNNSYGNYNDSGGTTAILSCLMILFVKGSVQVELQIVVFHCNEFWTE